jgi:hypothetical protein
VEVVPAESQREVAVFGDVLVDVADGSPGSLKAFLADAIGSFR